MVNYTPVRLLAGQQDRCAVAAAPELFHKWRVDSRRLLTPASRDGICCSVSLVPADSGWPGWDAGDQAEIVPHRDPRSPLPGELAAGLHVAPHGAVALLPGGYPSDLAGTRFAPKPISWPIASLRSEDRLDLCLIARPEDTDAPPLPRELLTGLEVDLRIRRQRRRLPGGPLVIVADSYGLGTARALVSERLAWPNPHLLVMLACCSILARSVMGAGIGLASSVDGLPSGLDLLPDLSEREEFARGLYRARASIAGFLEAGATIAIAGRNSTIDAVRAAMDDAFGRKVLARLDTGARICAQPVGFP